MKYLRNESKKCYESGRDCDMDSSVVKVTQICDAYEKLWIFSEAHNGIICRINCCN